MDVKKTTTSTGFKLSVMTLAIMKVTAVVSPVSYTHLTLPTTFSVLTPEVGVSVNKNYYSGTTKE